MIIRYKCALTENEKLSRHSLCRLLFHRYYEHGVPHLGCAVFSRRMVVEPFAINRSIANQSCDISFLILLRSLQKNLRLRRERIELFLRRFGTLRAA